MPRKNYDQWVHKAACNIEVTTGLELTTQCGKTARRIKRVSTWNKVTCPRCLELKPHETTS